MKSHQSPVGAIGILIYHKLGLKIQRPITHFECCLGSNKKMTGDILFLAWHFMPLMSEHFEMVITHSRKHWSV